LLNFSQELKSVLIARFASEGVPQFPLQYRISINLYIFLTELVLSDEYKGLSTKPKSSWNYETVSMFLVPILLGSAAVYVYWHSKRKSNIAKIEEYIRYAPNDNQDP
jgi:hypothetical protein